MSTEQLNLGRAASGTSPALINQSCSRKLEEGVLQLLPEELLLEVEAKTRSEMKALRSAGLSIEHTDNSTVKMGTKRRK